MKTHADMTQDKAWQKCQAGHEKHDRVLVDTIIGKMLVFDWDKYNGFDGYCTGQDDISRTLKNTGVWEPVETELVKTILENGNKDMLVMDIGAHIGWYSLLAAQTGYRVLAFEADEENIEVLKENARMSRVDDKITVVHTWVDENSTSPEVNGEVELVVCDIEGNEKYAIKMINDLLSDGMVKHLLMEVSPVFNDSYPELVAKIESYGYVAYKDGFPFNDVVDGWNFKQTNFLFIRQDLLGGA